MNKTTLKIIVLFVIIIFITVFIDYKYPSGTWRYRLTITLDTPEGEVSGSNVREISDKTPIISFPGSTAPAQEKGEAVVVDLKQRGVLFALIDWNSDQEIYQSFPYPGGYRSSIVYYRSLKPGQKANVPIRAWPKMMTFTDPHDATSIVEVLSIERCYAGSSDEVQRRCQENGPYISDNKLEEYFGEGVSIKSVTVEITDDPVTQGVVDPYLPEYDKKFWEWFKTIPSSDPRSVTNANFS